MSQYPSVADPSPATAEIGFQSVSELRRLLEQGSTTSTELVESLYKRMADVDTGGPELRAVLALCEDAIESAQTLDAERARGERRGTPARHPGAGEGQHRHCRSGGHDRRVAGPGPDTAEGRRRRRGADAGGRHDRDRQGQPLRVGQLPLQALLQWLERRRGPVPQSARPQSLTWWFQLRLGCRGGGGSGPVVGRHRD